MPSDICDAFSTRAAAARMQGKPDATAVSGQTSTAAAYWPRVRHFIAGSFSGCALVLAGHPFDTIKVRVQTAPQGQFKGPLNCLLTTIRREGPLAVYKGVTPPLVATGVINRSGVVSVHQIGSDRIQCVWMFNG